MTGAVDGRLDIPELEVRAEQLERARDTAELRLVLRGLAVRSGLRPRTSWVVAGAVALAGGAEYLSSAPGALLPVWAWGGWVAAVLVAVRVMRRRFVSRGERIHDTGMRRRGH